MKENVQAKSSRGFPHYWLRVTLLYQYSAAKRRGAGPAGQPYLPILLASGGRTAMLVAMGRWSTTRPAWGIRSLIGVLLGVVSAAADSPSESERPLWSLSPLVQPAIPPGAAHPVDAFIRARLAEKRLKPAPMASPRELLRRLSYDLTGLPPTPEELARFLADADPKAYPALVERLLASPRHGEHWARHWLDVANYADTHGNDHDYARTHAWPYRDYVIRSLNDDKPYARFVQEQVAGDALFPENPDATVALGFVAAGPWDHTLMVTVREDTVDHRTAQNLDRDNMVSTVMGTFQSLTIHCARCHNHKFDPISQREYYSLQAVFAGVDRANRPFDSDTRVHAERQRLRAERWSLEHPGETTLARLQTTETARQVEAWESARAGREEAWATLDLLSVISTGGARFTRQEDGSWFVDGPRADRDTYVITARLRPALSSSNAPAKLSAIRLEVLPDDRLPKRGPGRWDNGNFHLNEFRAFAALPASTNGGTPIPFRRAVADYDEAPNISAAQAIDGKSESHWGIHPRYGEPHEAVFELKEPTTFPEGTTFTLLLENLAGAPGHGIGRFRLSAGDVAPGSAVLAPLPMALTAILRKPPAERSAQERKELALLVLKDINQRALERLPEPQLVYAITRDFPPDGENFKPSAEPRPIHVLFRGELGRAGELVGPGTLGCVPGMSASLPGSDFGDESMRRAALARWLTDANNGLTWRSIVNRVWAWHFGRGLCETPNDFGRMGGAPSHPELLNWLAVWFRDEAHGSLKALHRLIVTSETWKQSTLTVHGTASDADNRLLWRQNRTRLSAEELRDTVLALSEQLDLTMGGPPAVQFNARGDATFMPGGNPAFVDYQHFDPDAPAARRRAIYRFLFRTVPDPLMDALDCPDGGSVTAVRGASTTAQQAFAMMNDAFLIRQCGHLAARIENKASTAEAQAEEAFRRILLREPRASEQTALADYIRRHGLPNACQLLINSNEFLYLD